MLSRERSRSKKICLDPLTMHRGLGILLFMEDSGAHKGRRQSGKAAERGHMPSSILTTINSNAAAAILATTREERIALAEHAIANDRAEVARFEKLSALGSDDLIEMQLEAARDALHYAEEALAELRSA